MVRNSITDEKRTLTLRLCFVACLACSAAIFGAVAYTFTKSQEQKTAVITYESVASAALERAHAIAQRKQQGGEVLSSVLSNVFPEAESWPFVALRGYHKIARRVAKLSSTAGHGMMVIVDPLQAEEFEEHAAKIYKDFDYPETAGRSEFGFGIYGMDKSSPYSDGRFHDTSGNTTYGSENSLMVPFLQHSNAFSNPNLLLMNLHQKKLRGEVLDSIIACAKEADQNSSEPPPCGVVTEFTQIFVIPGPAAVFFQPIFPADDPTTVVGFIGTSINWKEVLENVVPDFVDGLDCVICTDTTCHTYTIHDGVPELIGEGDLHDAEHSKYGRTAILNPEGGDKGASASMEYTLTLYPTEVMFESFHTKNPIYVSIGFVCVIGLCTAVFFLYDHFMKFQSHQRKTILEVKRRFVRFVSHEIRTPLNVVCMGLELLQGEMRSKLRKERDSGAASIPNNHEDTTAITDWLHLSGDVKENTQTAISVLNDLLNYDKIEAGTFKLEMGRVDIFRLVKNTVSEFSIQAKNRSISLDFLMQNNSGERIDEEAQHALRHLYLLGDSIRLAQVLRNLISNALKFSPDEGTVTVTARYIGEGLPSQMEIETGRNSSATEEVLANHQAGSIRVSVSDNGPGLSPEQVRLVFNEGVQFDANKLQAGGGSGLGLSIAKEIVQQHNGTIAVQSEGQGLGATFFFEIPLYRSDDELFEACIEAEKTKTLPTDLSISSASRERHNILVVDDSVSSVKMLVRLLERAGHTCVSAYNGQEAIDAFVANQKNADEAGRFDTVLMDYEMPVLNGPDAVKVLRELGVSCLVVGVTGNVLSEDVLYFKSCGADHVLPKPVCLASIDACWA